MWAEMGDRRVGKCLVHVLDKVCAHARLFMRS